MVVATGSGGTVALPDYTVQAVTGDNVGVTGVTQSPAAGTARGAGPVQVTLTAQDAAGNSASTSFEVAVNDGTAPVIGAPEGGFAPLVFSSGLGGTMALPSYAAQAVASDNVAVTGVTQSPPAGTPQGAGVVEVTLTAHDAAGNSSSTSFEVTVNDGTPPSILPPAGGFTPMTLATGSGGTVLLPDYAAQAVTGDNVGVTGVTQNPPAGAARGVGPVQVTLTARDASGNMAATQFNVAVTDGTPPTISGPPGTFSPSVLATGSGGTANLPSYIGQAVTADNVAITSITQSPAAGTAQGPGTVQVTLTAFDAAGNTAAMSFDVLVVTVAAPLLQLEHLHNPTNDTRLSFGTSPGLVYKVHVSTDLVEWTLRDTIEGDGSVFQIDHVGGGNGEKRFYKVEVTLAGH